MTRLTRLATAGLVAATLTALTVSQALAIWQWPPLGP
jgi:hypothetical protein